MIGGEATGLAEILADQWARHRDERQTLCAPWSVDEMEDAMAALVYLPELAGWLLSEISYRLALETARKYEVECASYPELAAMRGAICCGCRCGQCHHQGGKDAHTEECKIAFLADMEKEKK